VSGLDWGRCFPPIEKRDGWGSLSCGSVPEGWRNVGQPPVIDITAYGEGLVLVDGQKKAELKVHVPR